MRPRGSDDWGQDGQEDWRAPHDIRENHDITQDDMEREAELDRWLGYVIVVISILGLWKVLDLVIALVRWAIS